MSAVKELRSILQMSQQALAVKLNVAVRTVARWETGVAPKGKALAMLLRLALEAGTDETASVFQVFNEALKEELSVNVSNTLAAPETELEKALTCSLIILMRVDPSQWPEGENPVHAVIREVDNGMEKLVELTSGGLSLTALGVWVPDDKRLIKNLVTLAMLARNKVPKVPEGATQKKRSPKKRPA
jgi:transcriptional regulator with XRE-family HTH domain